MWFPWHLTLQMKKINEEITSSASAASQVDILRSITKEFPQNFWPVQKSGVEVQ